MNLVKSDIRLKASAKAVIAQFLSLPGNGRTENIINRLKKLSESDVESLLEKVMIDFKNRHRNIEEIFMAHFGKINNLYKEELLGFSEKRKLLIGAFFTKEYSIQAAALFNPSIVTHPDQQNLPDGSQRFVMSLRATGEGHISSIIFQTGVVTALGEIKLDESSQLFTPLKKNETATYSKDFIIKRVAFFKDFKSELLDLLPAKFTAAEAIELIGNNGDEYSKNVLKEIIDTNYELESSLNLSIGEKVIFPNAKGESMGMEDARFVKFEDGENSCYYSTYTAYNGHHIKTQLIKTKDFDTFKIRTLYGNAISDKGMALFPEKINGKYVMVSRQGGEKMSIMYSNDLYVWDEFKTLMEPLYPWEMVQLGNCGSPVKTEKGWLLLTHAVGAMRTYVISAILLDLNNPSIILGRLDKPLIEADEEEREGYVPNVVYTCGLLQHGEFLIIPYAVSDSATGFATIKLNEILLKLQSK
ncbi:MAG: glycoside hydrolase family 130 protein [Bacteroidota bacterium]|nr:glycoside hydrolase family 130 protein [Bacteroidota bacterium]